MSTLARRRINGDLIIAGAIAGGLAAFLLFHDVDISIDSETGKITIETKTQAETGYFGVKAPEKEPSTSSSP